MNAIHQHRLYYVGFFLLGLALAAGLIFYALKQNMNIFITPSEMNNAKTSDFVRLGGMVKPHSLIRDKQGLGMQFIVTDFKQEIIVRYNGILPDLFREGKGVVVEGKLSSITELVASQVLAKHDENYMPPKIAQAIRSQGNL